MKCTGVEVRIATFGDGTDWAITIWRETHGNEIFVLPSQKQAVRIGKFLAKELHVVFTLKKPRKRVTQKSPKRSIKVTDRRYPSKRGYQRDSQQARS